MTFTAHGNKTGNLTVLPVFSKCADSIEGGKRLENLSWRLWNRETFCCEAQPQYSITPTMDVPRQRPSQREVPALSSSVESAGSDEQPEQEACSGLSPPLSDDSALSRSRGKEKHLTPLGLEKMFFNIKEQTEIEPLSPSVAVNFPQISEETPRPSSPAPQPEPMHAEPSAPLHNSSDSCYSATTVESPRHSDHRGSDTSVSSGGKIKSGSVVHGFSPSPFSSSFRARVSPDAATPAPKESSVKHDVCKKRAGGMFTLGGSSGDDESSFEDRMSRHPKRSSLSERLKQSETGSRPSSFRAAVQSRQIRTIKEGRDEDEGAIESDDEEMDESAIEDEDSDWEDSITESGKSSVPEEKPVFKRVDSHANLVSRKSLLTRGLHEPQRAAALAEAAMKSSSALRRSRTSSPNGPSGPASPTNDDDRSTAKPGVGITRSKPILCTTSNTHLPAHSPRTTRRNMLATELTESLRRHLLWERQQKSTTANAVYKRRHTAHNEMANLHEFPGPKVVQPLKEVSKTNSWNNYFDYGPWEYHTKGW